jgi:hypothetical protein
MATLHRDKPAEERELVRRLLQTLGEHPLSISSAAPPAPDVPVALDDGRNLAVEVTELHPDETGASGSSARADEERRVRTNPGSTHASWVTLNALPAIDLRITEKIAKRYVLEPGQELWLLVAGSIPRSGSVASTFTLPPSVDALNAVLHAKLEASAFQSAFLYLPLSGHALLRWTPATRWVELQRWQFDDPRIGGISPIR